MPFSDNLLKLIYGAITYSVAPVAQSAEHNHGKVGVSGSIPLGSFLFFIGGL